MRASVRFRLPDGTAESLFPGDLIGRTWSAALRFDVPDVSEAHAMVSLRGERLWLLALRRRFTVADRTADAAELSPGLVITLAPGLALTVDAVRVPATVLGLEGPGLAAQALPGTSSLLFDPNPRLAAGLNAAAAATFWETDDCWRVRINGEVRGLSVNDRLELRGQAYVAVEIPLSGAGQDATRANADTPLRILCSYDTVQIHRSGAEPLVLVGQLARVVSELASVRQPLSWAELARPHWPQLDDPHALRRRWDGLLVRLRDRLRDARVRTDLVQSTGTGLVELVLLEGDVVEDRS